MSEKSDYNPSFKAATIWHNEEVDCNHAGSACSMIVIPNTNYSGNSNAGAALYQHSSAKFDIWPYSSAVSYNEQNELFYFIK
ncbi:hypothetical protein EUZ85_11210 [Hahella sp. KA22]|uniref:hypothetical protein n=1 Tax=Hahella sp. KA22 TaxID=1628392 RepID=UPI0010101FDB|nr:hypothetical protein [Hahella sp. KA22]QAY54634.1 hypothetical protein EUZ85_11210 [Hahella sp. KA22]